MECSTKWWTSATPYSGTKDIEMAEQTENQDNNCATSEAVDFQDNSVEGEENESSNKSD